MKHSTPITIMLIALTAFFYWVGYKTGHDVMQHDCGDIVTSKLKPAAPVFYITTTRKD